MKKLYIAGSKFIGISKRPEINYCVVNIYSSLLIAFLFLPAFFINSYSQKPSANNSKTFNSVDPLLERSVRNTLKKSSLKLQLIENNGQDDLPIDVIAYFSSANETVFIEKNRLRIVVAEKINDEKNKDARPGKEDYSYNSFNILFKGSAGFDSYQKEKPFDVKRNFIRTGMNGSGVIKAESYGEITLKEIYPGIDLRLYSQENGHLEFDWIIWPGADLSLIKMEFTGQQKLLINKNGELLIELKKGDFTMRLPESYWVTPQGKQITNVQFGMKGKNIIHFTGIGKNQNKYPLVIDPDLLWGTFFDGANANFDEYLYAIDFNPGNELLYCAGAASMQVSTVYAAALSTAWNGTFSGIPDALIYALTKDGQFVRYITYLGGTNTDVAIGLSLSDSFVYACGFTASNDFPVTKAADGDHPAFDSVYHGNKEGFVSVFNLTLDSLFYCSYLGGFGDDVALTIRAVQDSSFYISLSSDLDLFTGGPDYLTNFADNVFEGNSEAWIGKFDSFNSLRFGTYIGGNDMDLVNDFQVLNDGDVVFAGNTLQITEVNASIADNGSGQEVLFGRINVPASGTVNFDLIEKIGGSNNDMGWGIISLGDTVSVIVGQTNSNNFPLGAGMGFQITRRGNYDAFLCKLNNDGSGNYNATYVGGSDVDILVSVRPVMLYNDIALMSFGSTESTDLATFNIDEGSLFSNTLTGGLDMMFLICDLSLQSKYYLSYIGGTANDYLGKTGAPIGSNHLYFTDADSVLYLGTTTHSYDVTHSPKYVGRGVADIINSGVPVFDETKGNTSNDTHTILAITTKRLFVVLPLKWVRFGVRVLADCSAGLSWKTIHDQDVIRYTIERSSDGIRFKEIGSMPPGQQNYYYNDNTTSSLMGNVYYRVIAEEAGNKKTFSNIIAINLCDVQNTSINIYPTVITNSFTVSGLKTSVSKKYFIDVIDESGKKIINYKVANAGAVESFYINKKPSGAFYLLIIKDADSGNVLKTQKVLIGTQ